MKKDFRYSFQSTRFSSLCYSWYLWTDCIAEYRPERRRLWRRPPSAASSRRSWSWRASQRRRTVARPASCHRWSNRHSRPRHRRKIRRRRISRRRRRPPFSRASNKRSRNSNSQLDAIWAAGGPPERSGWPPKKRRGDKFGAKETRWQRRDAANEEWITPMPYSK